MLENKKQVLGFHNQGIGILKKNGGHTRGIPLNGVVECHPVPDLKIGINGMNPFLVKGNGQGIFLKQPVNVCANQVNIFNNIFHRAYGKFLFFICRTKGTAVPRTVPDQTQQ
jgi:hypothetical protein